MGFLFGSRGPKEVKGQQHPSWILSVSEMGKRDVIPFLRKKQTFGRVFLLVSDGVVRDQYTTQTSIEMLRLIFNNYLVYEIDVQQRDHQFNFTGIPMKGGPANITDVEIDMSYDIVNAEVLFRSKIAEIEPVLQRNLKAKVMEVCGEFLPRDYVDAKSKLLQVIRLIDFDFGVAINTVNLLLRLPGDVQQVALPPDVYDPGTIEEWKIRRVTFFTEARFYDQPDDYKVKVSIRVELDRADPNASQKLRSSGITNPEKEMEEEARRIVREALREFKSKAIKVSEETAEERLLDMRTDFGLRISSASVEITKPEELIQDEIKQRTIDRKRRILTEAINRGRDAFFTEMAINPELREALQDFVRQTREAETYQIRQLQDGQSWQQTQMSAERREQVSLLRELIEIRAIDPESDPQISRAVNNIFNAPLLENNKSASQLPSSAVRKELPSDVGEDSLKQSKRPDVNIKQADAQHDIGDILPKRPKSDYDNVEDYQDPPTQNQE